VSHQSHTQILVVGAESPRRAEHVDLMQQRGYEVLTASSGEEAVRVLARWKIACVIADAADAGVPGALSEMLRNEPTVAIVVLADEPEVRTAVTSMRLGAMDYLAADSPPEELRSAVDRALARRDVLVRERIIARSLREEVGRLTAELRQERHRGDHVALAALESLVFVVEAKDAWLAGHSVRVAQTAASLAAALGRTDEEVEQVRLAGRLHDIGMVAVDEGILSKEGPLTPEEFEQVRAHATIGSQILRPLPDLGPVIAFVRHHHERWDGQGYPDRLAGDTVPWGARVIGVAEIYDALTTSRPYRQPMPPELAVNHMKSLIDTAIGAPEWRALASVVGRREALVFVVDEQAHAAPSARASNLHL
jgi:putative two-component system response regulator